MTSVVDVTIIGVLWRFLVLMLIVVGIGVPKVRDFGVLAIDDADVFELGITEVELCACVLVERVKLIEE